ncbi:M56 family metallopeptidase [Altibacter sp. HG106]|uniref:M56 family metallopeptidase n=1 Tax=Altibacter sp. HG106 TaxID=3023937 RepID=UPI0023502F1C|nr:M56 family metallopeptidase [Altibacter sp. HG106]MDC7994084.1 M56 family metallopeptidase [Altibacter sp. HG106]
MIVYAIKSILCLGILYMGYLLLWERTSFHHFKRGYLLSALVISLAIPGITITEYIEATLQPVTTNLITVVPTATPTLDVETAPSGMSLLLWGYILGVVVFLFRFGNHVRQLWLKIQRHVHTHKNGLIHVQLDTSEAPHTFLQYIFLPKEHKTKPLPQEVIQHEEAHAIQRHSLDVLLVEFLQVFFWFHPVLYFYKRSMKLNHEFLADQAVLQKGVQTHHYQKLLLAFSGNTYSPALTHSIQYSSIKKRFTIMKTTPLSKTSRWARLLFFVPVLALLVWGFSSKEQVVRSADSTISHLLSEGDKIRLYVHQKEVTVNGQKIAASDFAKTVDALTKNWSKASMNSFQWDIFYDNADKATLKTLESEFLKTNLYKVTQRGLKATPPPPPPPAPDANKTPPPPPAPETDSPPAPERVYYSVPEPPPPPNPDPVEYVKELAKRGAIFYSGPHKNSLEQMLELARKSDSLQLDLSEYPIVRLSGC